MQGRNGARRHQLVVGRQFQAHQIARELQCVRDHVVGELWRVIKGRHIQVGARGAKETAVKHHLARDVANALQAQLSQQFPQLGQTQFGVGAAAQNQVTLQHVTHLGRVS